MIDWRRGGWTGSLNGCVRREIREHFRDNNAARRARYPAAVRLLHRIYDQGSFTKYITAYAALLALVALTEFCVASFWPEWLPHWTGRDDIKTLLPNLASYLISAQVGVLGVISIAIGLVTLIAQREGASTDVQVYYHESVAFGVVASSIALLAVLCAQLLWPVQFTMHWFGRGTSLQFFKLLLTSVHLGWLLLNLGGLAYFVATTLAFVQQSAREGLRESYTANIVLPAEMRTRLREQLYLAAGPDMVTRFWGNQHLRGGTGSPTIYLGQNFGQADVVVPLPSTTRLTLYDVRMVWVQRVIRRWLGRCQAASPPAATFGNQNEPLLMFPPRLDDPATYDAGLCRRRGGVPFTWMERMILRRAFKFRKTRDEA